MPPRPSGNGVDLSLVVRYDRKTFIDEVWDYGDTPDNMPNVTILCPYGGGKTQLGFDLLSDTVDPELRQAYIMVMKPRDNTVKRYAERDNYPIVRVWPPPPIRTRLSNKKPAGFVVWPQEHDDPDVTDKQQTTIFRRLMRERYRAGKSLLVCDELASLESELGLQKDVNRILSKGRSNGCGMWGFSQRPVYINRLAFQAQHLFLGNDPDELVQKRYGEIGAGIGSDWVRAVVASLQRYEFCYINREDRTMCIVGA